HLNPEETLPENTKRLRISGIGGSEFPEPTIIYNSLWEAINYSGGRLQSAQNHVVLTGVVGRLAFDISTPNSYKLLTWKSLRYFCPVSNDMSETKSILRAGEQLKELRLRLGMTTRDVTDLSQKIIDSEGNQE